MISQELFEEVMGFKVDSIYYDDQWEDASTAPEIVWSRDGEQIAGICIYYLAHKCKEWAYENDYYVYSIFTFAGEGFCYLTHENNISKRLITFEANTEPEAIFRACTWILENKEK